MDDARMLADLTRAEGLLDVRRPKEALEFANQAAAAAHEDARPRLVASRALIAMENPWEAERAAQDALRLEPVLPLAALLIAITYSMRDQDREALYWVNQALRMDPEFARAHVLAAQLYVHGNNAPEAVNAAERAIGLDPEDPLAHATLATALHSDRRIVAAEQAYRASLELNPNDASAQVGLGAVLARRGKPEAAAELLLMAARTDVRDDTIQQQMLRYVRGAAWGLGTLPVILIFALVTLVTATDAGSTTSERLSGGLSFGALTAALIGARLRRLWRFPPEARRLITRRSLRPDAFEVLSAKRARRPWWWHIIVRVPLTVRVAGLWLIWVVAAAGAVFDPDTDWTVWSPLWVLLSASPMIALSVYWWRVRRRELAPHPFY